MMEIGTPPMVVHIRKNKRARRLTLRVSSVDGRATVTVPPRTSQRVVRRFLTEQQAWLRTRLSALQTRITVAPGLVMPIGGEGITLTSYSGKRTTLAPGQLLLPDAREFGPAVQKFLINRARQDIGKLVQVYAQKLGQDFGRLSLRDPRSRWGSCASSGNLMFSWRLILAPPDVLEYVVAHEVAHLIEMNHSAAFWQVVQGVMPEYLPHKHWLRDNGAALHRYDFTQVG